jgi:hypothetical protein
LQAGEAREGHASAVLEHRDHAGGGRLVFFGSDLGRRLGREDFATQIAPELLDFVHRRRDRHVPDEAHEPGRRLMPVDLALQTARAVVAGKCAAEDVNLDGHIDLLGHFRIRDTGLI